LVGCNHEIGGSEKTGGEPGEGKSGGLFQNSMSDRTEGFLFQTYTNRSLFLRVQLYCKPSLLTEKCYVATFQGRVIKGYTKIEASAGEGSWYPRLA